jgi:opacity protein-like surface antigen
MTCEYQARTRIARERNQVLAWPITVVIGAAAFAFGGQSASAAEEGRPEYRYEITPYYGVMGGGGFEDTADGSKRNLKDDSMWGLVFNFDAGGDRQYEIFYGKQSTAIKGAAPIDLDVQFLQIGGTVMWPDNKYVIPYIVGTVGGARLSPDGEGLDSTMRVAFTFGGGLKIPIVNHVSARLEARGYATLMNSSGEVFCRSNEGTGTCAIRAHGSTLLQYSVTAGVAIGF